MAMAPQEPLVQRTARDLVRLEELQILIPQAAYALEEEERVHARVNARLRDRDIELEAQSFERGDEGKTTADERAARRKAQLIKLRAEDNIYPVRMSELETAAVRISKAKQLVEGLRLEWRVKILRIETRNIWVRAKLDDQELVKG